MTNAKYNFFIIEKMKKYLKCPALIIILSMKCPPPVRGQVVQVPYGQHVHIRIARWFFLGRCHFLKMLILIRFENWFLFGLNVSFNLMWKLVFNLFCKLILIWLEIGFNLIWKGFQFDLKIDFNLICKWILTWLEYWF